MEWFWFFVVAVVFVWLSTREDYKPKTPSVREGDYVIHEYADGTFKINRYSCTYCGCSWSEWPEIYKSKDDAIAAAETYKGSITLKAVHKPEESWY